MFLSHCEGPFVKLFNRISTNIINNYIHNWQHKLHDLLATFSTLLVLLAILQWFMLFRLQMLCTSIQMHLSQYKKADVTSYKNGDNNEICNFVGQWS